MRRLLLKGLILPVIFAGASAISAEENLPALERDMRARYEDFYRRMNELRIRSYETKEAKAAERRRRENNEKAEKQAREEYIRQRKRKIEVSDELHEREVAERKKKHEAERRQYIQSKERTKNRLKNVPEIPGYVEYRLYDDVLVSDSPAKSSN